LVTAFQATLEELTDADLLLHVVDVATPDWERRIAAVRKVLDEIGISDTPELLVFNQIDRLPAREAKSLLEKNTGVAISALKRIGLEDLLSDAEELLWAEADFPSEENRERKRIPPLAADEIR
jgi:GTP-binding protein HflX